MTYKAIVKNMIAEAADAWVRDLMKEAGIRFDWTSTEVAKLEDEKHSILWTAYVDVVDRADGYTHRFAEVGGTVDDMIGICCSVIFDEKHNPIWFAVPDTRKAFGIEEFKLA